MNAIENFKDDLWNGIYFHARKLLIPSIGASLIYLGLVILFMVGVLSSLFTAEDVQALMQLPQEMDMESMMERNQFVLEIMNRFDPAMVFIGFILFYVIILLIFSWFSNLMLNLSEDIVLTDKTSFVEGLKTSFNGNFFRLFSLCIMMLLLTFLLVVMWAYLVKMGLLGISFIGAFAVLILLLKFIAAPGAIVHGKMSVPAALSFSWENITFKRAFKAFVVLFVFVIILFITSLLFISIFSFMGSVGSVLTIVYQVAIALLVYATWFSAASAAFFRYAEVEIQSEDHTEELPESA